MGQLIEALRECDALLQIALDFSSLSEAIKIARMLPEKREIALEAGTPLIKSWGMVSIRALRSARPNSLIVADTKTADVARIEAEIVAKAGGNAFTVLTTASDETLRSAAEAARDLNLDVYGDTISQKDPIEAVLAIQRWGLNIVLLHIGIDVQRSLGVRASSLTELIRNLADSFNLPVAVAGGVRPKEMRALIEAGARIVIIGSAVTRASDPRSAVLEALSALTEAGAKCR
ncbi:MAG: orotidine 5'-phosphate decarboxylase / HUMPS family protein [Acidilobaceae archaeon]